MGNFDHLFESLSLQRENIMIPVDSRAANKAAHELQSVKNEEVIEKLANMAASGQKLEKARAINILGKMGKITEKRLITIFQGERDQDLKFLCATALGKVGNKKIIEYLITLLGKEDILLKNKAAISLEAISSNGIMPLIEAMGNKDASLAEYCAQILCRIHPENIQEMLVALDKCPNKKLAALVLGSTRTLDGVNRIIAQLESGVDPEYCKKGLLLAGPDFVDRLLGCLNKVGPLQEYLPPVIASYGEEAQEKLSAHLKGASDLLKISILQSLDHNIFSKTTEILQKSLKNKSVPVLKTVAKQLAKCGEMALFDLQKTFELDEDIQTQYWALYSILLIGKKGDDYILDLLRRDDEPHKKEMAIMILGQESREEFLPAYLKMLSSEDLFTREYALKGLKVLGLRALDQVIQILGEEEFDPGREMALNYLAFLGTLATPQLKELLNRGDETNKYFAAYALGETGDKTVIPDLLEALNTGNQWIQKFALCSLFKLGGVDAIENHIKSHDPAISKMAMEAITEFDEKAARILIELAGPAEEKMQNTIIAILAKMGDSVIPVLDDLSQTAGAENSRKAALKAKRKINSASLGL